MTEDEKAELAPQISALFSSALAAHHRYETEELKGQHDEEWSTWYANYMLEHGILDLFPDEAARETLKNNLVELLVQADNFHRANFPDMKWQDYYAQYLLDVTTDTGE